MADAGGKPIVPTTIEGLLIQLQRRLNEVENRERGTGRRGWGEALVQVPNWAPLDNGFPGWRLLNDGRVELRGRISVPGGVTNGTLLMYISGRCAPPGDGATYRSWLSAVAPCSSSGTNPGVYRIDIERVLLPGDPVLDEDGNPVLDPITGLPVIEELIYAAITARPPANVTLTDWVGFDHAIFDPNLYIDTVAPVPSAAHNRVWGRGYPREDGTHVVQQIPGEFGIAVLGYEGGGKVVTVPGMEGPATIPPLGP